MPIDNQWAFDLETKIFSVVNEKAMAKVRKNYPNALRELENLQQKQFSQLFIFTNCPVQKPGKIWKDFI